MTFERKIRCRLPELRARKGRISLRELSRKTGLALATLSKLDSGKSKRVDFETWLKLAEFFSIPIGDLFEIDVNFDEADAIDFSPLESVAAA